MDMERRKANPEQLNMLLRFLEDDKELALGRFRGLKHKMRQTSTWIKITEKLNASCGKDTGAIRTPEKWQQTWSYWKANVRKKALNIRKNRSKRQLTEDEEKILRLVCTNTAAFGLAGVPETTAENKKTIVTESHNINNDMNGIKSIANDVVTESHNINNDMNGTESIANDVKWSTESHSFSQADLDIGLEDNVIIETTGMETTEIPSTTLPEKPTKRKGRPVKLVHDKLLNLEEERIKIEKLKFLEKKRCNNIKMKMEKDRLDIERQRNALLEKLLVAVEMVAHR